MMTRFAGRVLAVFSPLAILGHVAMGQQADHPVTYTMLFQVSADFYNYGEPSGLSISLTDEAGTEHEYSMWDEGFFWYQSGVFRAKLLPNKSYQISISVETGITAYLDFWSESPALNVLRNGQRLTQHVVIGNSDDPMEVRLGLPGDYPLEETPDALRGGDCTSLVQDKPIWYLGLGRMRNGGSAGAVGFRKADFSSSGFFTPAALHYENPDSTEIDVIRTGSIFQIYSREVLVDIDPDPTISTKYSLKVYPRSQVTGFSGGEHTVSGSPFVTYTVESITVSGGAGVKITRVEDSETWQTSLELSGSTWTHRDWRTTAATSNSYAVTDFTSTTQADVSHTGPNALGTGTETPLTWRKTFTQYGWGKEVDRTTFGPSETVKVETQYSYYTTNGSGAHEGFLKWMKRPDGSWVKYDYLTTGMVQRVWTQWLDNATDPAATSGDTVVSTSNSAYEDWTYALAIDGSYRLPASRIQYAPGGNILSKTEWSHTNNTGTTLKGHTIAQWIRYDYASSGSSLATTTRYYREDNSSRYLREKPTSVQYPDGRKDSYAYYEGTWADGSFSVGSGDDRSILCFHGQTSGGTTISSWGTSIDPVQMVAGRSTISQTVIDRHGRLVHTAEYVYNSSGGADRIAATVFKHDSHGRLTEEIDVYRSVGSTEFKVTHAYTSGLRTSTTAVDGVVTTFEHDGLLRLVKTTVGSGGSTPYPAKISEYKYDGANRVAAANTCGCSTEETEYSYDPAGRREAQAELAPDGNDLITAFDYGDVRTVTTGLPNGATRIETRYYDGRPKSVTGTAQPAVEYTYEATSTGLKTTEKHGGTLDNGFVETTYDWLGRPTKRATPAPGYNSSTAGNNVIDIEFNYNSAGQLWRERTKYRLTSAYLSADRIRTYDAAGRLLWEGLDVDDSGTLSTSSTNDRITAYDSWLAQDGWGWLQISTVNVLPNSDTNGTAKQVSYVSRRLTGFNNGSLANGHIVAGDVVSFDATERYRIQWDFVHPTNKVTRSEWAVQGGSIWAFEQTDNGYASTSGSVTGVLQKREYDARGRLEKMKSRWTGGSTYADEVVHTYATANKTSQPDSISDNGITTSYTYAWDSSAKTETVTATDAASQTTHIRSKYTTNGLEKYVWGSAVQPTREIYDALGRRATLTTWRSGTFTGTSWPDPGVGTGATTTWVYDAATGLVSEKKYADHVDSTNVRKVAYTYTPLGQLHQRTWTRSAITTTYAYYDGTTTTTSDVSHRTQELRSVSYSDGTPTVSYTYKRTGAPDQITDSTGTRTFTYRSDLQLDYETLGSTFHGSSRTLTPPYATINGVTSAQWNTGWQFKTGSTVEAANTFTYDSATMRIATVAGASGSPAFTYGYTTTGTDWVTTVTSGNYVRTHSLLGDRQVLDKVETTWSSTNRGTYDSAWDARGLRASVDQSGDIVGSASTNTFTHDDRRELTKTDNSADNNKDFDWEYDLIGKRTLAKRNGSTTATYSAVTNADKDVNQYASITGRV